MRVKWKGLQDVWEVDIDGTDIRLLGDVKAVGFHNIRMTCKVHGACKCGVILAGTNVWDQITPLVEHFFRQAAAYRGADPVAEALHHTGLGEAARSELVGIARSRRSGASVGAASSSGI
jgi:hypothetical protein